MIRLGSIGLRNLTLDGLRGRIAPVAQDTYLFNDTLEANVQLAKPGASREQIELALSLAGFVVACRAARQPGSVNEVCNSPAPRVCPTDASAMRSRPSRS